LPKFLQRDKLTLGAKVARNVSYSSVRLLLLAPLPFVLIPYFLKKLGNSGYGTWAVLLAISSLTSLADVGLVTTLSKHVAEFYARKDFRALNRLINTGFALCLSIAAVGAASLWLSAPWLLSALFRGSSLPLHQLQSLWRCLIGLMVANILTLLLFSVVVGLQRMDVSACLGSANVLASAGLSVLLLHADWGLRGILYAYAISAWLTFFAYIYALERLLPEMRFDLTTCRWAVAKEILSFSLKTYVTQMAVVIHNQIEKIYLAHFVGVVEVGWYDISSDIALKLRSLPGLMLAPMMPAASELDALGEHGRLRHFYQRAHKYLAFAAVPMAVFVVFSAKSFVRLWLGAGLSVIAAPLSWLLLVNLLNLTTGPGYLTLVGKGILKPGLSSALAGIVLNASLSLALIWAYGFPGAVIGTSISIAAASVFFLYLFQRQTRGAFPPVMPNYRKALGSALAAVLTLWLVAGAAATSWTRLALRGAIFSLVYLSLLLAARFFDAVDLAIAEAIFPVPSFMKRLLAWREGPFTVLNWATRYYPILRALREYPHQQNLNERGSLLEVGAGPVGIGRFYRAPFVGCDLGASWRPIAPMLPVMATGSQLPFKDRSFEAVILSDVLEHVPPSDRLAVIEESLRVARGIAIFGFPSGAEAEEADRRLARAYDRSARERPSWLQEHLLYPYPGEDLFAGLDREWEVSHLGNASAGFHYWTMRREMCRPWAYLFIVLLALVPRSMERLLRRADRKPYYRKIVVLRRSAAAGASVEWSAAGEEAPAEAAVCR
jgi:O-antigen/teichoic acid export membrane protein